MIATTVASLSTTASMTKSTSVSAAVTDLVIPGVAGTAPLRNVVIGEGWDSSSPPQLVTKLAKSRILVSQLSPLNPSLNPFAASENDLIYDNAFLGKWRVASTLKQKIFPYGTDYLPSPSLYEGSPRYRSEKPGDTTTYEIKFFQDSKGKVRSDRVFNSFALNSAYNQFSKVEEIQWNYDRDPTRLTILYSTLSEDFQPLGKRRGEIYITARNSESGLTSGGDKVYCVDERIRSVLLVPGNVVVSDTENIVEYKLDKGSDGNRMTAVCRIAVYLTPNPNSREGILWQEVNGKAVAFYDYEMNLERIV